MTTTTPHRTVTATYSDPSAAHERALRFKLEGAYRVSICTPRPGKHNVLAIFTVDESPEKVTTP